VPVWYVTHLVAPPAGRACAQRIRGCFHRQRFRL